MYTSMPPPSYICVYVLYVYMVSSQAKLYKERGHSCIRCDQ